MSESFTCPNGHPIAQHGDFCPLCETLLKHEPLPLPSGPALPTVPGYEILEEVGRGGMGVVYKALQKGLNRLVALKMIHAGPYALPEERERFRREAEAVARLQHPNVVQIYEVGEHNDLPYLALEFVAGGSLAQRLAGAPQPAVPAARLVEQLARAAHAMHQKGIVHRDLKPANVLLPQSETEGQRSEEKTETGPADFCLPTSEFVPKITDFGLAKRLEESSDLTPGGAILGTPSYMAPEQAWGTSKVRKVGPATDVYALGAILYELLTGRPPFRGQTALDTVQQVLNQEPVAPSRLQPKVPADLETICLKCLEKEPGRRYSSAEELAEDLRRFREGLPILARPVSRTERLWRWCRRKPAVAGLLAGLVAVFLAGLAGILWQWREAVRNEAERAREARRANRAAQRAREAEQEAVRKEGERAQEAKRAGEAEQAARARAKAEAEAKHAALKARDELADLLYVNRVALANREWFAGRLAQSNQLLKDCVPAPNTADRRSWEWYYLWRRAHDIPKALPALGDMVTCLAASPDGKLVTGTYGGTVTFWHTKKGSPEPVPVVLGRLSGSVHCLSFSPVKPCRYLVAGTSSRYKESFQLEAVLWDLADIRKPVRLPYPGANGAAFDPADDTRVALALEDGTVRVWDRVARREVASYRLTRKGRANGVSFSADGKRLAAGGWGGVLTVWDTGTRKVLFTHEGAHDFWVTCLAFSPDPEGKLLASAGRDRTVKVWDGKSGWLARILWHPRDVNGLAFHPTQAFLATAGEDQTVRIWNLYTSQELNVLRGNPAPVHAVAFSSDGGHLWTGDAAGAVRLWEWDRSQEALAWKPHRSHVFGIAFNPDSRRLASASSDFKNPEVCVWEAHTGKRLLVCTGIRGVPLATAFSHDGKLLAAGSSSHPEDKQNKGQLKIWNAATGAEVRTLPNDATGAVYLAFSPHDRYLAWTKSAGAVYFWDLKNNKEVPPLEVKGGQANRVVFSPDGKYLATVGGRKGLFGDTGEVHVWEWPSRKQVQTYKGHHRAVGDIAFLPDGRRVASAAGDRGSGEVRIWAVASGKDERVIRGKAGWFYGLAPTPDGKRLMTGGQDGTVRVWDLRTGQELLLLEHGGQINCVVVSPDGHLLAAVGGDLLEPAEIRVWDGTPLERP